MDVNSELFRSAWSKFPTGVTVITSNDHENNVHGMTANAVLSVSNDPPMVIISVGIDRQSNSFITTNKRFGVNILSDDQTDWAEFYAMKPENRGDALPGEIRKSDNGIGILDGALTFMDCEVTEAYEVGDHTLLLGTVVYAEWQDGWPLLYHEGDYLSLNEDPD